MVEGEYVSMLLTTVLLMYIYTACWLNNYVVQLCPFWWVMVLGCPDYLQNAMLGCFALKLTLHCCGSYSPAAAAACHHWTCWTWLRFMGVPWVCCHQCCGQATHWTRGRRSSEVHGYPPGTFGCTVPIPSKNPYPLNRYGFLQGFT